MRIMVEASNNQHEPSCGKVFSMVLFFGGVFSLAFLCLCMCVGVFGRRFKN